MLSGGHILGIPMPVILALALAALLGLVVSHTRFGRHILAVGSNINNRPALGRAGEQGAVGRLRHRGRTAPR